MIKRLLKSTVFQFILVFATIFVAFYFYRDSKLPYFIGEDSFYHVGLAKYMIQNGLVIHQFPFFSFTFLKDNFVDWHFLFHILLIPFIKIFGETNGPKILGDLLVAGTFGMVFLILREQKLKLAWFYAIALFFLMPSGFYYRMVFIRAPVVSVFLLVLSIYLFLKNKPLLIGFITYLSMLFYYGSFVVLIPFLAYFIVQIFRGEKLNYQLIIWPLIGFLLGIIINPYFPQNIHLLKIQLSAGLHNDRWYAGQEWLQPGAWSWFYGSIMTALLFFGGIVLSYLKAIKLLPKIIAIFILSLVILVMQWKSIRFIEYWPVLAGLTGLLLIGPYLESVLFNIKNNWRKLETMAIVILILAFVYEGIFHGIWEYWSLKKSYQGKVEYYKTLKTLSDFLESNSSRGDIVFTRWDIFPQLFYFSQKNYYIVGEDPAFLEDYNKDLLEKYIDLTMASDSILDVNIIKERFMAKWVIADENLKDKILKKPELFQQVFENNGYTVFKVL